MVSNAALYFSGVTPAQQDASTVIGTSGRKALSIRALETTQISVHRSWFINIIVGGKLVTRVYLVSDKRD